MKLAANARHIFSGRVIGLGMGKQTFIGGGLVALLCMQAIAGPEGERVVHGQATFTRNGLNTVIHAGNNAIIDYRSFDIRAHESVQFIQPGTTSRVLNRVPDAVNPTRIDGSLTANGIVYIVNSAGVYFGNQAVVNAAGLYAAAGQMTNADFLNNVNHFTNLTGTVSNAGTVNAGAVALIGKHAENLGTINAPRGLVTMAAGDDVFLGEVGGTMMVQVAGAGGAGSGESGGETGVNNAGTINAPGGTVRLAAGDMYTLALKMPGRIIARDTKLEAHGSGTAIVSGTIDASATRPGERGGTVQVLGDRVALAGGTIDASGPAGGGTVLIGGDFQGRGDVRTASQTVVTKGSTIRADATEQGDGGKVIVWADGTTRYHGGITTKGGEEGGNGGFVEVSGKRYLDFNGAVDTSAVSGRDGTLLLDPDNITIVAGASPDDGEVGPADGDVLFGEGPGSDFVIGRAALESVLGDIILQAEQNIAVNTDLTLTNQGVGETFTLRAGDSVTINGDVTTSGASIVLSANDPSAAAPAGGSVFINGNLSTAGAAGVAGDITLTTNGGAGHVEVGADLLTDGGDITIADPLHISFDGVLFDTEQGDDGAAGNIQLGAATLSATGFGIDLTLDASSGGGAPGSIALGAVDGSGGGFLNDLSLSTSGGAGGTVFLLGDILLDANGVDTADLTINAADAVLGASVTIDTEQGDDGNGGAVNLDAALSGSAFGFDLTVDTGTAVALGAGGEVLLSGVGGNGGGFLNDLLVTTDAATPGTLTIADSILLDANGGDTASLIVASAPIDVGLAVTIDTEQGDDGDGGSVDLGIGGVSSSFGPGAALAISTGTSVASGIGGDVTLGAFGNALGDFLRTISLDTSAATPGQALLTGSINLAFPTGPASFTVINAPVVIGNSITIDTEQGDVADGGLVDLGTGGVSASSPGLDLTINTATSALNRVGGAVTLPELNNAGGAYINDLSLNVAGGPFGTNANVTFNGDIRLDNAGGDTGDFLIENADRIMIGANVVVDTEQGDDGNGGSVNFQANWLTSDAFGRDLDIRTGTLSGPGVGGAVTLRTVNGMGGGFLNDLRVDTSAATPGGLTLVGDVLLDANGGDAAGFTVVGAPVVISASMVIDTEQGNDGAGGTVDFGTVGVSASVGGIDLAIDTSTGAAGEAGGAITLPLFSNTGGAFLNDFTITRAGGAGGANGALTLNGDISLDDSGGDAGDFTINDAGSIVMGSSRAIDTEQGDDGPGGDIVLSASTVAVAAPGIDLVLDASTAAGGSSGGNVMLPAVGDAGGEFLNDLTVHAGGGAGGGTVFLPSTVNLNGGADIGDFTITGASVIDLAGDTTIDTDGAGGSTDAGGVSFPVTATINGADALTIDATADNGGASGSVTLSSALGNTTRLGSLTINAGAIGLGMVQTTGDIQLTADSIDFTGGAGTVNSDGAAAALTILPSEDAVSIRLGDAGAGILVLDTTDLGAIGVFDGGVTIGHATGTSLVTIGNATFNSDTTIRQGGVGGGIAIEAGSAVATANDSSLTFVAGTGDAGSFTQGPGATIDTGAGALAITSDSIALLGGASTISTTSTIILQTATASRPIVIGDAGGAGDFALDDAEVGAFADGSAGIEFGSLTASNPVTIGEVTFNDALSIMVPVAGGSITIDGTLTVAGDASTMMRGSGSTIFLNADIISTDNSDITLDDNVVVSGDRTVAISGPGVGGDILITGTVNAETAGVDTLALSSEDGAITLQDHVGDAARLGAISFDAFTSVTLSGDVLVTGGGGVNFLATPSVVFTGTSTIDTDDLGGATDGGDILFDAASSINMSNPGSLFLLGTADGGGNAGNVTLGAVGDTGPNLPQTLSVGGAVVTLNGDITTSGPVLMGRVSGSVVLGNDVTIDNTAGANDELTVHHVSGNHALTLNAGAGSQLTVNGADVDTLTLAGGTLRLGGTIETDTAQDYTSVGVMVLQSDTALIAQDSDNANAPQDITTDAANSIIGAFMLAVTGNNISLPVVGIGGASDPTSLVVTGAGNVTLGNASLGGATITADSDMDGVGTFTISSDAAVNIAGGDVAITAADVALNGDLSAPNSAVVIERSADGAIALGDAAGDLAISRAELANIFASSLTIGGPTKTVDIRVDNVQTADLANVTGAVALRATGNGASISFQNAASTFASLDAAADNGISIDADVSTTVGNLVLEADADNAADTVDALAIGAGRTVASAGLLSLDATSGGISGAGGVVLNAVNGVNINDSFMAGGTLVVNADTNADGAGSTTLASGATITTNDADLSITGADLVLDGSVVAGAGTVTVSRSTLGAIRVGGVAEAGELGIGGDELQRISATRLSVGGTNTNVLNVDTVTAAQSDGISGVTELNALADLGVVNFVGGPSAFNALSVSADDGISIDHNLSTDTGDILLNANADGNDDTGDRAVIAPDVGISSQGSLSIFGGGIRLTGGEGTTNTFSSGNDGNVFLSALAGDSGADVVVTSENNATLGSVQLVGGDLSVTFDSNSNAAATLALGDVLANSVTFSGGADINDVIDVNLNITGAAGVTASNVLSVNIGGQVIVTSDTGPINFADNVASVVLDGADDTTVTLNSTSGGITLAPVSAANNPNLTIATGADASFTSIELNGGDLLVNASVVAPASGSISIGANDVTLNDAVTTSGGGTVTINNTGVLTLSGVGPITADGGFSQTGPGSTSLSGSITTTGDVISFAGPVVLTGGATLDTGAGPGDINFLGLVRSDSPDTPRSLTLTSGTGSVNASSTVGVGGALDQLRLESVNNATFAGDILANVVTQVAGTGVTTFQGELNSQGTGGIDLNGNGFTFQGSVLTTAAGAGIAITNTGTADFQSSAGVVASGGAFLQDGVGPVTLAASLFTSSAPISFAGPVTVPADITISNNGAGDINFGGTLTTSAPVTIDGGADGSGNINFSGAVSSAGELIARTGSGAITFANSVNATSAVTADTDSGAITFNGPLSVGGAMSATSDTGTVSFANTVNAGSVFLASTNTGNIQFSGLVNGAAAGSGIFILNAGQGDVLFNQGANVGLTTRIQSFSATGRNVTVQSITTQGTSADGDGDITLVPNLTVTENVVTEFPGQVETDNRPNGIVRINGDIVANNGNINIGAAGRDAPLSVAGTVIGNSAIGDNTSLSTFTIAANAGDVTFGEFDKVTAFGNLSVAGRNVTLTDTVALGSLNVNAGNTVTVRVRPSALLLALAPDGSLIRNQVDFGTNIVARNGLAFTAPNFTVSGSGSSPSFASADGVGTGIPGIFPVAIRDPFSASSLRQGDLVLSLDARGTTNTGLASALASAIPRDTELGMVTESTSLGQADRDQLLEIRIDARDPDDAELLDFLSGRSLYEDAVLDPDASAEDYYVSVNRLPASQVAVVLATYRAVFKTPRIDPDTGEVMIDEATGSPIYDVRDREIRDELAAALRRFRKEGREGTLDPVEFRRYLETSPEEEKALGHVEALQDFFEQLHLLGLGPREEENSRRTLLGRVTPSGMRVQQLAEVIKAPEEGLELD